MSFVVDWRSSVSWRTQCHHLIEIEACSWDSASETEGRATACVSIDARDWTHFVLVYVHVLRVRRRVGRIVVIYHMLLVPTIVGPGVRLCRIALPPEACAVYQMHYEIMNSEF